MNTCATSVAALAALMLCAGAVAAEVPAQEEQAAAEAAVAQEPLHWKGRSSSGAQFYVLESPFDEESVTSFFEQYRFIRDKDDVPPWFLGVFHLDAGVYRADETSVLRLEWWNPNWLNERAEGELDWKGLEIDLDYMRYRSAQLRFFPQGTFQNQECFPPLAPPNCVPVFGTRYTDPTLDAATNLPTGRFFSRRWRVAGQASLRPAEFDWNAGPLDEVLLSARREGRSGVRQRSTLLDDFRDLPPGVPENERFRGIVQQFDQNVTTLGAGLVASPRNGFTSLFQVDYEQFRERAPTLTGNQLFPATPPPANRAYFAIPDTNRLGGSAQLARRFGRATVQLGAYVTQLKQVGNRSPFQQQQGLDDTEVLTWSADLSGNLPFEIERFGRFSRFGIDGYFKALERRNDFDYRELAALAPPDGQVDPFLRRRSEYKGGAELYWRPAAGSQAGLGYRGLHIDRDLRFATTGEFLTPQNNLLEGNTTQHTFYVRARARLLRGLSLSGELGGLWAPEVGFPRDFSQALYFEGRASYSLPSARPTTLQIAGGVTDGRNDASNVTGANGSREKSFERTQWNWVATLSSTLRPSLSVFASVAQNHDEQEFAYLRSDFSRYTPGVRFFLDSNPVYRSDVVSLITGAHWQATDRFDLDIAPSVTWVRADFARTGQTSVDTMPPSQVPDTAAVLENVNAIRNRILSLDSSFGYEPRAGLRFEVGYRFDHYYAPSPREQFASLLPPGQKPFSLSTTQHTIRFAIELDWNELRSW